MPKKRSASSTDKVYGHPTISIRVEPGLLAAAKAHAQKNDVPVAWVFRQSLARFLGHDTPRKRTEAEALDDIFS